VLLPVAAMMLLVLVLSIPLLLIFGVLAISVAGIQASLAHATGAAAVVRVLLEAIIGLVAFAVALLLAICFGGPLCIGIRNYALLFYGGRYPALGDILSPPPPPPPAALEAPAI
jgi:hypothetical protein